MDLLTNSVTLKVIWSVFILIFLTKNINAHNPNTASVVISPVNGIWLAQFTISQVGANYALNKYYEQLDLSSLSTREYQKLYVNYIKSKTSLVVNGRKVEFTSGGIRLGNHQTDMKFLITDFPSTYQEVNLKLSIFDENLGQHTVVRFIEGTKSIREILSHGNQFQMNFKNEGAAFVPVDSATEKSNKYAYITISLCLLAMLTFVYKMRK